MDTSDQLAKLANSMSDGYNTIPLVDPDTITLHGNTITLRDSDFMPIPHTNEPAAAAYVDGGNAMVCRTPMFVASVNRVYSCAFRGRDRLDKPAPPRVQFLTLMRNVPTDGAVRREFETFSEGAEHARYVPDADSIKAAVEATRDGKEHRLHAVARGLAEWRMAAVVASGMGDGDMVVMDGALFAWRGMEEHLMREAFAVARERGVIMCGLSKTTGLLMDSGRSLADHVMERGPEGAWYVPLGDVWKDGDPNVPGTFVVRLHPASKYAYRLDIDADPLIHLGRTGTERLIASLAANSGDAHIPGYPYGLVDADRFAQVRNDEASRYGAYLRSLISPRMRASVDRHAQHDDLNGVTS